MPALSSLNLRIQAFFSAAAFAEAGVVESAREIVQLHSDRSENVGDSLPQGLNAAETLTASPWPPGQAGNESRSAHSRSMLRG